MSLRVCIRVTGDGDPGAGLCRGSTVLATVLSGLNKDECERRSCTLRPGPVMLSTPVPALGFLLIFCTARGGWGISGFISPGYGGFGRVGEGPVTNGRMPFLVCTDLPPGGPDNNFS